MSQEAKKATVKATGEKIEVYKLIEGMPTKDHVWQIFLGDKISLTAIEAKQHERTFKADELTF